MSRQEEKPYQVTGVVMDHSFREEGKASPSYYTAVTLFLSRKKEESGENENIEIPLVLPAAAAAALLRELSHDDDLRYSQHLSRQNHP